MSKLIYWFGGLVALTFLVWVSLTSPTLYECLSNQPQNETGNSLQEYVASFYVFLLGSRTCVGSYIHENE